VSGSPRRIGWDRLWRRIRDDADRWLLVAAASALALSFLSPSLPLTRARFEQIVVLDVTQSMNVADEAIAGRPVSRLDWTKHLLGQAIDDLPCGSRLGWAIFTEYRSYLLWTPVEVCANRAELRATLAAIDGRMAWTGNSEIAKGLHSAWAIARELTGTPAIVFVTDGQESPPLNPRHRPRFDDKSGEVAGLIVGVGQVRPSPIPKTDPAGRPIGFWGADQVVQVDPRSLGRGASVGGEKLVEDDDGGLDGAAAGALGAAPGSEHLSGLHEPYLRLLAAEHGLAFIHPTTPQDLSVAMRDAALARPLAGQADLRGVFSGLALLLVLAPAIGAGIARARARVRTAGAEPAKPG
jgi:mxaL protein